MQKNVNALRTVFSSLPAATGFIRGNSCTTQKILQNTTHFAVF
jgi:hypothetical protein